MICPILQVNACAGMDLLRTIMRLCAKRAACCMDTRAETKHVHVSANWSPG